MAESQHLRFDKAALGKPRENEALFVSTQRFYNGGRDPRWCPFMATGWRETRQLS